MKRNSVPELCAGGLVVAAGILFIGLALSGFELFGHGGRIGAAFVPVFAGLVLALSGLAIVVNTLKRRPSEQLSHVGERPEIGDADSGRGQEEQPTRNLRPRQVAVSFGLLGLTIVGSTTLGFFTSFGILLFVLLAVVEREKILFSVTFAAISMIAAWFLFDAVLKVPFPQGVLP